MRINKYIASCGVASRRSAEELIRSGKVKLNGKIVSDLATIVNLDNDVVTVNGKRIKLTQKLIYIMLNKPKGCVSTVRDTRNRKTIMDYLQELESYRIFPVGRLDYNTEGLLILTNDGELCHKLTHPSNQVPKTYIAKIEGSLDKEELSKLQRGITLDNTQLQRCKVRFLAQEGDISRYEITIREGRNRQIHRMFEFVNKNVVFLKRVAVGDLRLGGLSRGSFRYLTDKEIDYLQRY